jgi:predicted nuclease with TOPRIM domain
MGEITMSDIDDRLDRLESLVERQREAIEKRRERRVKLEAETEPRRGENGRLRERGAELDCRLDRIEAQHGVDGADQQGVADD